MNACIHACMHACMLTTYDIYNKLHAYSGKRIHMYACIHACMVTKHDPHQAYTYLSTCLPAYPPTFVQTCIQTYNNAGIHVLTEHRQTDSQTDSQKSQPARQTDGQMDRRTDGQADGPTDSIMNVHVHVCRYRHASCTMMQTYAQAPTPHRHASAYLSLDCTDRKDARRLTSSATRI